MCNSISEKDEKENSTGESPTLFFSSPSSEKIGVGKSCLVVELPLWIQMMEEKGLLGKKE